MAHFGLVLYFGVPDLSDVVNMGQPILTIALTLILVNMNHALLSRDIPVTNFAKIGWPISV